MTSEAAFSPNVLRIDPAQVADGIRSSVRAQVHDVLRRRGVVVGISGGVDSSVVASLCVGALGAESVLGLFMPEEDSDPESARLARLVADGLGIQTVLEDIAPILRAAGCYQRREEFIRQVVPEYGPGYKCKLVLSPTAGGAGYNIFSLVVQAADGAQQRVRLPLHAYLGIVAATNMKQRTRKQIEYYHADRLHYAVAGTPNRLEYDQGFFVKNGDGSADLKPIAHLYKSQVYQLAEFLGVPEEIRRRPPTTDTYSLAQTQEEFYFSLPYDKLDFCLYALNHAVPSGAVAEVTGLTPEQVEFAYRNIKAKRRATRYQHQHPILVEPVTEVDPDSFLKAAP
jgi:NAD+ synthase